MRMPPSLSRRSAGPDLSDAFAGGTFWFLILLLPFGVYFLTYWLPLEGDVKPLAGLSAALLIILCAFGAGIRWFTTDRQPTILFSLICLAMMADFGLRSFYLLLYPDVVAFPNVDAWADLAHLHRGLIWAQIGVVSMILGYTLQTGRKKGQATAAKNAFQNFLPTLARRVSGVGFMAVLYVVGWCGRAYMLKAGSAFWFYNSRMFDTIADRPDAMVGGVMEAISELCPIAVGAYASHAFSRGRRPGQAILLLTLIAVETVYYGIGLAKFGIVGAILIPWVARWAKSGTIRWKEGLLVTALFVGLILPLVNALRSSPDFLRIEHSLNPSNEMASVAGSESRDLYASGEKSAGEYMDALFWRMNGAEGLIVAQKYIGEEGYAFGQTYVNIARLSVPRVLRFWSSEPYFIPWETAYVGHAPSNWTTVPMPALIEAFLNFGVVGVVVVMFVMGWLYKRIDLMGGLLRSSDIGVGIFAYLAWRLLNIEHNLFDTLLPPVKTLFVLVILAWIFQGFVKAKAATLGAPPAGDSTAPPPQIPPHSHEAPLRPA